MVVSKLLISLLLTVSCLAFVPSTDVREVRDERTFRNEVIASPFPTIVMFKAVWCGHCQRALPEFESAARMVGAAGVSFAFVECPDNQQLCSQQGVQGYPTFKIFNGNGSTDGTPYNGARETQAFAQAAMGVARDTTRPATYDEAVKLAARSPVFATVATNGKAPKLWRQLAVTMDPEPAKPRHIFAVLPEVPAEVGARTFYIDHKGVATPFEGENKLRALVSWCKEVMTPKTDAVSEDGFAEVNVADVAPLARRAHQPGYMVVVNSDLATKEVRSSIGRLAAREPSLRLYTAADGEAVTVVKVGCRMCPRYITGETAGVVEEALAGTSFKAGLPSWMETDEL